MISLKEGIIIEIINCDDEIDWIKVSIEGNNYKAVNYSKLTGNVSIGDKVILNTTAVELSLGTGGYHFVVHNHNYKQKSDSKKGHIMKLRYTPMQIKCLAAEEQSSPHHEKIKSFTSLSNYIFLTGSLHSMVAPIASMIKYLRPKTKINYIMTDGGALPLQFSLTVKELKKKGIIDNTITIGHSFGGDFECVNIYTGLITSKEVLESDITIIAMGPGIVGTGTRYGYSGIEQGSILDAVNALGGKSIAIPRITFSDNRDRHRGISHHTLTVLNKITFSKCDLVLPILSEEKNLFIEKQINNTKISSKHNILYQEGENIKEALDFYNLKTTTMGRNYNQDKDYFISLGAVGKYAVALIEGHQ
ncbi:DUF3866 family protein [Sporosalibacterium faouarense]|uniref:DUF3866 family protein n=1 Tax=Sporosalibacterium faouarense TaxID=516123 RepID=UPI00141D5655|nr:DUF3866 family protein [Sporosalibacterium faouarense]MTI48178.1 DUF3866 family protein [Bacillota bacterium]